VKRIASVLYRTEIIGNRRAHPAADQVYYPMHVVDEAGMAHFALATVEDMQRMIERGRRNPDDRVKPAGGLRRLWAWWFR
jgi:hypothetical protein